MNIVGSWDLFGSLRAFKWLVNLFVTQ